MSGKYFRIVLILISAIILLGLAGVYGFQDELIFQADELEQDYTFKFAQSFQEYTITTKDGEKLNALLFSAPQSLKGTKGMMIYFHGNSDNLQRWGEYAVDFTSLGYDVLMIDYRGFGKSSGTPSEQNLYEDGELVWSWARANFKYDRWVIYGRSLGSAVASHLAAEANPALLILETPFDELRQGLPTIALPFSLKYKFSNKEHLEDINCRVVIIQGTDDWVVSEASAKRLIPYLKPGDKFVSIPGGGHKNLRDFELFHSTLSEVL